METDSSKEAAIKDWEDENPDWVDDSYLGWLDDDFLEEENN